MHALPLQFAIGDSEPREEFDYDALDAQPETPRADLEIAEGFARLLLDHVIRCPKGPRPCALEAIGLRAVLLAELLAPTCSCLTEFAAKWGGSKQQVDHHSTRLADELKIPLAWSASPERRAINIACQLGLLDGTWVVSPKTERRKLAAQRNRRNHGAVH